MVGRIPFRHIPVSISCFVIPRRCRNNLALRSARPIWSAVACRRFPMPPLAGAVWIRRKPRLTGMPSGIFGWVSTEPNNPKRLKFAPPMPITMLEVLPWQTLSAQFRALCSPHTLLSNAQFATQAQTQLRSSTPYLKTRFRSANRAQLQVKRRPHRKARKARASRNPAKPNKLASL
jgi:hypothetical protein